MKIKISFNKIAFTRDFKNFDFYSEMIMSHFEERMELSGDKLQDNNL